MGLMLHAQLHKRVEPANIAVIAHSKVGLEGRGTGQRTAKRSGRVREWASVPRILKGAEINRRSVGPHKHRFSDEFAAIPGRGEVDRESIADPRLSGGLDAL